MSVDDKLCHFCSQLYWTSKYISKHEDEEKKNTEIYKRANAPLIAKLSAQALTSDPTADEEMIENHCINTVAAEFKINHK